MDCNVPLKGLLVVGLILIRFVNSEYKVDDEAKTLGFHYHNYDEMTKFLKSFTQDNGHLTKLYSIGRSIQKRELWVVELHNRAQQKTIGVPNVKVIGNMHGNEPAGREVILHLIEYLVNGYRLGDAYCEWLLDNTRIHLMPSLNPDGFEEAREGACGASRGRENHKKFDLNRNFPDYFRRNSKTIQPETLAVMKWLKNNTFVLSASLHGGTLVASYPFENTPEDMWAPLYKVLNDASTSEEVIMLWKKLPNGGLPSVSSPTPDDDVFRYLAMLYAKVHPTMHMGVPCEGSSQSFKDGVINGALWYPMIGGMQDYNYVKHGCMEITLEISCCRYPTADKLQQIWEDNKQALLTYISQVHRGLRGVVRSKDGQPVRNAVLQVLGRNMTFNTSINGEFWRILMPGNYLLQIEADGFVTKITPFTVPKVEDETKPNHLWLELSLEPVMKNNMNSGTKTVCCPNRTTISIGSGLEASTSLNANRISTNHSFSVLGDNHGEEDTTTDSNYELHLVVINAVHSDSSKPSTYVNSSHFFVVWLLYLWYIVPW